MRKLVLCAAWLLFVGPAFGYGPYYEADKQTTPVDARLKGYAEGLAHGLGLKLKGVEAGYYPRQRVEVESTLVKARLPLAFEGKSVEVTLQGVWIARQRFQSRRQALDFASAGAVDRREWAAIDIISVRGKQILQIMGTPRFMNDPKLAARALELGWAGLPVTAATDLLLVETEQGVVARARVNEGNLFDELTQAVRQWKSARRSKPVLFQQGLVKLKVLGKRWLRVSVKGNDNTVEEYRADPNDLRLSIAHKEHRSRIHGLFKALAPDHLRSRKGAALSPVAHAARAGRAAAVR